MRVAELVQFLASFFNTSNYPLEEQGGIFPNSDSELSLRTVQRIGLALEPEPRLADWIAANSIDTLWLHRPWALEQIFFSKPIPVLSHHLPFDETLTIGYNQKLASALNLKGSNSDVPLQAIGYKQEDGFPARAIGLIGHGTMLNFESWCTRIVDEFGGYDEVRPGQKPLIEQVAVVGAMNEALIYEAAERGAGLYITGQYRKGAQKAVDETGIGVIAIGHQRSEEWGLRALANELRKLGFVVLIGSQSNSYEPIR